MLLGNNIEYGRVNGYPRSLYRSPRLDKENNLKVLVLLYKPICPMRT